MSGECRKTTTGESGVDEPVFTKVSAGKKAAKGSARTLSADPVEDYFSEKNLSNLLPLHSRKNIHIQSPVSEWSGVFIERFHRLVDVVFIAARGSVLEGIE